MIIVCLGELLVLKEIVGAKSKVQLETRLVIEVRKTNINEGFQGLLVSDGLYKEQTRL